MKLLTSMRVGPRLGFAFGIVLVFLAGLCLAALQSLSRLNGDLRTLTETDYVNLRLATTGLDNLRGSMARLLQMGIEEDPARARQAGERLAVNLREFQEANAALESRLKGTDGEALHQQAQASGRQYLDQARRVQALVQAGQRADAQKAALAQAYPVLQAAASDMRKLLDHSQARADAVKKEAASLLKSSVTLIIALGLGALACGVAFAWWVSRSVTGPIGQALTLAQAVAQGDLRSRVQPVGSDEPAQLLRALQVMNDNLARIVGEVRAGSDHVATGSGQIASGNADLSRRTEMAASSLQETAASMEQLSATVRSNADTAQQARALAAAASSAAVEGGSAVAQVVQTMEAITDSSRRIADIIGLIDGIAFQTNILALNAAVEAARAGEQGRGFAVVAGEVRNLAQRCSEASRQIRDLIGKSVQTVESGRGQVAEAGRAMDGLLAQVQRVDAMISQISSASVQQAQGIAQVREAVGSLDQSTQQNASLVEEGAAAAESLHQQADRLLEAVRSFRLAAGAPTPA